MRNTLVFAVIIIGFLLSACDELFESRDKGMLELKKVEQRWTDGVDLAGSTARIALSSQVANLQAIKRDLNDVEVSECLKEAKTTLGEHMEFTIQGFLEFMGDHKYLAEKNLEEGRKKLDNYRLARDKCIKRV